MMRKVLSLVVGCLLVAFAYGQQTPVPMTVQSPSTETPTQTAQPPSADLDGLIREALQKNPGVQSAQRQVEALRHRVPQARTLPDPTVSVGWAGNITPFSVQNGDSSSNRAITASQGIPYPGKLKLRGEIADREAEAAQWDYEAARRKLVADVKSAYYDYFAASKAVGITQKNKDLLQKLSSIAEARYRVGKGVQQDVLRSQVEISLLQQRQTVFEQQQRTAQVRLNTLLLRDPEAPLPSPASFEPAKLAHSLDELYTLAREQDTGLQREQRMIERNQYAVNLAQKDYRPDFNVGYMYQQRPDMKDMHGFTVTANIPIYYRTKQREAVREQTEQLASSQRSKENRQTELSFAVKQQYLLAKSSEQLLELYSQAIVPQSSLALESSMASYQVGAVDFLTILTNFTVVLDYEVSYYRELANYQMALANLEPLVGVELTK
ncbi:MAG: TolC family protein [Acidobacteria bacterium]|nr:TolC family protein [Acidobacteriota bacterium]